MRQFNGLLYDILAYFKVEQLYNIAVRLVVRVIVLFQPRTRPKIDKSLIGTPQNFQVRVFQ